MLDRFLRAFCTIFITCWLRIMGLNEETIEAYWPLAGEPLTESPGDEPPISEFGYLP